MNLRLFSWFFLTVALNWFLPYALAQKEDPAPVIDAFNQSVEKEAKRKIGQAEEAERRGEYQKSQHLIREAMFLETLKVEEGRVSEEKILALKDSMSAGERKDWVRRFIQEGDRLAGLGLYDLAVDEYEKVFLLEPEHRKASRRIDRLKKQFLREQYEALDREGKLIEEEVERRIEIYLNQTEELIGAGNYLSAKRTAERILALEKKNKKARKLLKEIASKEKQTES